MLANSAPSTPSLGTAKPPLLLNQESLYTLLRFVLGELTSWRDRPERPEEHAEDRLSSNLCSHLNSAARRSNLDHFQFQFQGPDELVRSRSYDLTIAPRDEVIVIEGRTYYDFTPLLPLECKRLPTPAGRDRDEREYVFNRNASTGGIQRFKEGHHAATHHLAAMIAYVQRDSRQEWWERLQRWIAELIEEQREGWSTNDLPHDCEWDDAQRCGRFFSSHERAGNLESINLVHLWIEMTPTGG